jgi:hypothetical protein
MITVDQVGIDAEVVVDARSYQRLVRISCERKAQIGALHAPARLCQKKSGPPMSKPVEPREWTPQNKIALVMHFGLGSYEAETKFIL